LQIVILEFGSSLMSWQRLDYTVEAARIGKTKITNSKLEIRNKRPHHYSGAILEIRGKQ
jgi:hypothetical protein